MAITWALVLESLKSHFQRTEEHNKRHHTQLDRIEEKLDDLLERTGPSSMTAAFKERNPMAIEPQIVTLHPGATYDIAGFAQGPDGAPITLTNLKGVAGDTNKALGDFIPDSDPKDDNDAFTASAVVGATDTLTLTADGADGKVYEALVSGSIIALDVQPTGMLVKFTERVAAPA